MDKDSQRNARILAIKELKLEEMRAQIEKKNN